MNRKKTISQNQARKSVKKKPCGFKVYQYLIDNLIITRNRSTVILCENCIRITIGTPEENSELIDCLQNINS